MSYLVLVRHGESTWNKVGAWTGLTEVSLDEKGKEQAKKDGQLLLGITFQRAFISSLIRARQSLDAIKEVLGQDIPTIENAALDERDYGDLTGKNKWEVEKIYGEEQFESWRRGWDVPVPNGETLKDVYERVVPYYEDSILPKLKEGENVLIVAHGNSLRALTKFLENISDEDISNLEIEIGEIIIYQVSSEGKIISKEIKS